MQSKSRESTNPGATNVYPIEIKGFERVWGIHGGHYKTTFLTIIKDKGASLNAIYYPVNHNDIQGTDQRESGYCRVKVSAKNIIPLGLTILPEGSYWAYAQKNNDIEKPNKEYPLAQSCIDVFLDGCIDTPG